MKGAGPHVVYYAESFCGLSETFVYRTAQCLSALAPTTVLTHDRVHSDAFPDDGLHIEVEPQLSTLFARVKAYGRSWIRCGVRDSHSLHSRALLRVATHRREGVVFAQFGLAGVRALGAAKAVNWPMIVNFHGADVTTWLKFRGYAQNLKALFNAAGVMFLVPSHYLAAKIAALGAPETRTYVYYNPVPVPEMTQKRARNHGAPLVFLHAGRLVPVKGITYTLKAFVKAASVCDCRLRVIGAGPEMERARDLAVERGIAERVTFLGAVESSVVQREMSEADVFVQHSMTAEHGETEGLPVAICEAMANGLPVVSTRHAGIPEVVEEGVAGILVDEKDVDGMARALCSLALDDDLRMKFGEAGRKAVEQRFCMSAAQSQLQAILNHIM